MNLNDQKKDTELAIARLLDTRDLTVWSLPPLLQAADDAVAIATERGVILFGGYWTKPGLLNGMTWHTASRVTQRLSITVGD